MAGKVCDAYCLNCIYYVGAVETAWCCNYYLQTDKRRPCDPGTGCTVRVLREKNRKTRKDRYIESISEAFIAGLTAEPIPEIVQSVKRLAEAAIKNVEELKRRAEDG